MSGTTKPIVGILAAGVAATGVAPAVVGPAVAGFVVAAGLAQAVATIVTTKPAATSHLVPRIDGASSFAYRLGTAPSADCPFWAERILYT
jgi:hypothetical protein